MSFDGGGNYIRNYNWTQDAANSIPITASRFDAEHNGFAGGLSNCITRDGQGKPIADISWNGHKITGLADPSLPQDAMTLAFVNSASGLLQIRGSQILFPLLSTVVKYDITPAETAVSVTPVNYFYPEGYVLRYGTNTTPGTTNMITALNNATKVCAYGKAVLVLPAEIIRITSTWDCTAKYTGPFAYPRNTNGGLWVRGAGKTSSYIIYDGGVNNVGIGWDMSGGAFGRFEGFTFAGGVTTANCPQVTLYQGAINVSGIVHSLNHTWIDVEIDGYGDIVVYNAGCEQQNFIDCTSIAFRDNTFGSATPWVFVASGSVPTVTSALTTTYSPVNSMTVCHWHGANAALIFHGSYGIFFHFTGSNPGACADIRFDDWFQVQTPSGPFKFMTDDSAGAVGQGLINCGGERLTMEVATGNGNIQVANFNCAQVVGLKFEGVAGNGSPITARCFQFASTCIPTGVELVWNPSEGPSTWTADYVAQCAGTEAGIKVFAPGIPDANVLNITTSRTIDGFPGVGQHSGGSGYALVVGTHMNLGATGNAQFNRTRKVRAGAFVTSNSDWNEGVQTTPAVTTSALTILNIPNFANIVAVTGADAGGDKFCDLLWVTFTTVFVLRSETEAAAPAARTYSIATSLLKLTMASGTYAIQASCIGFGMQT